MAVSFMVSLRLREPELVRDRTVRTPKYLQSFRAVNVHQNAPLPLVARRYPNPSGPAASFQLISDRRA